MTIKIALSQVSLSDDINLNAGKAIKTLEQAASNGAAIVCFPELQYSLFFPQYPGLDAQKYRMPVNHKLLRQFQEKCSELKIVGIPNFYLEEDGKSFDASPVINSNGELLGISKMVHIVQAACFFEQDYYTPSDSGFQVFDTTAGKIGVVICFDRHFPESIRSCVLKGAEIIIIPTANTKAEPRQMFEWELRVSAMQNGVFIAMCNRVGIEGNMDFCGDSIVVSPDGEVLSKADANEQILYADLDLELIAAAREKRPFLKLRRPECYLR